MHRLVITTPASDRSLLTTEEMRAAAGVPDNSQDAALTAMEKRVAALITSECDIAVGEGAEPTLRRETVEETFFNVNAAELILSRMHKIKVNSLTVDGTALTDADYVVRSEAGLLHRLQGDCLSRWCARKIVVAYEAGFQTVPDDLKQAAIELFRMSWLAGERDPLVKAETVDVDGIEEVRRDYWVGGLPGQGTSGGSVIPSYIADQLKRYRNVALW